MSCDIRRVIVLCSREYLLFLSDEGPMLETLDYTIRIGSTSTFLYFDLYLYSAYAAHYVYNTYHSLCSKRFLTFVLSPLGNACYAGNLNHKFRQLGFPSTVSKHFIDVLNLQDKSSVFDVHLRNICLKENCLHAHSKGTGISLEGRAAVPHTKINTREQTVPNDGRSMFGGGGVG